MILYEKWLWDVVCNCPETPPRTHLAMDRHVRALSLLKSICYLLYIYMELYAIQLFIYLLYKSVCYYVPSDFQRTRCWRPSDCLGLEPCGVNSALPWLSRGLGCCPRFSVGTLRVSETGRPGTAGRQGPQGHKEILLSCSTLGTCSFSGFREHEPRLCPLCWYKAPRTVPVEGNGHSLSSEPLRTKTKRLASPIRQIKGLFSSVFKKKKKKKRVSGLILGGKKEKVSFCIPVMQAGGIWKNTKGPVWFHSYHTGGLTLRVDNDTLLGNVAHIERESFLENQRKVHVCPSTYTRKLFRFHDGGLSIP